MDRILSILVSRLRVQSSDIILRWILNRDNCLMCFELRKLFDVFWIEKTVLFRLTGEPTGSLRSISSHGHYQADQNDDSSFQDILKQIDSQIKADLNMWLMSDDLTKRMITMAIFI